MKAIPRPPPPAGDLSHDRSVGKYLKHYFPSPATLVNAIRSDLGYGLVPSMQAGPLIRSGELVALAPRHDLLIDLYWHHWESEPEPLARISALVIDAARKSLVQVNPREATRDAPV